MNLDRIREIVRAGNSKALPWSTSHPAEMGSSANQEEQSYSLPLQFHFEVSAALTVDTSPSRSAMTLQLALESFLLRAVGTKPILRVSKW